MELWSLRGDGIGFVWRSALHSKVLSELLDLQQVLCVDGGTRGGQGAQHVRLEETRGCVPFCSLVPSFPMPYIVNTKLYTL